MVVDISARLDKINLFPQTELVEVIQNVRTIITTIQGTVPLDRDFGIDVDVIDKPINVVRPLLVKEIKEKLEKYEPRAKLISINWDGDGMEGKLIPTVRVAIK